MACTTLLVGKDASFDGSTIIARNEDSPNGEFCPKNFTVVQPQDQPRHYKSVLTHFEMDLPDNPMRYTAVPNALSNEGIWAAAGVNEANVAMTATETLTSNERVLGADPLVYFKKACGKEGDGDYTPEVRGGISEEDMVTLVLPYIHSAREGVERLGHLLETYGTYEMNGIAFSDTEEIWWLETVGGHHWIARRVPDDAYVTMPNQLGIDEFDLTDAYGEQKSYMCSADLKDWMDTYHLDLTLKDDNLDECACCCDEDNCGDGCDCGDDCACNDDCDCDDNACCADCSCDDSCACKHEIFNPRDAFGSHSDADHVYNTPRAWSMHKYFVPSLFADPACAPWQPESDDIPWCLIPDRKITMEDVKYSLSLHYQGTVFDPYSAQGTAATRSLYRPIGINRNSELAALQLRGWAPRGCQALQWMAYGSNAFNALVPFYANVNTTPVYLNNTTSHVDTQSFYWANRLIGALADAHFNACANHIEHYQEAVGSQGWRLVFQCDKQVEDQKLSYEACTEVLEKTNQAIADMTKQETDITLDKVLYSASMGMKNGFNRSDH